MVEAITGRTPFILLVRPVPELGLTDGVRATASIDRTLKRKGRMSNLQDFSPTLRALVQGPRKLPKSKESGQIESLWRWERCCS